LGGRVLVNYVVFHLFVKEWDKTCVFVIFFFWGGGGLYKCFVS